MTISEKKSMQCQFSATPSELGAVRAFVRFSCDALGVGQEPFMREAELATHEAFMNIINHGDAKASSPIIIECQRRREGLSLRLYDQGRGDFSPKPATMPPPEAESGRGLAIIFSLVDKVEFTQKSKMCEWNQLHLFKKCLPS